MLRPAEGEQRRTRKRRGCNCSLGGVGTPAHLIGEQFKLQTSTRAQHVPYAQFPQAIGDLLNGTNAFMFITMLPALAEVL
ncbi:MULTISPECIES: type 2 periplasmic-binding domain-containing protein [Bradyrhizobium]|uniref:tripartite tricarboxylate transporter substrate-binding protein n=1 Tax=Bradyrhizobium elkanii TaxID=29448 RepID=UPI0004116B43|nr:tripartite tricarboxylate transporter substrate-binding protein [Bradyrhizobium elkanii]